MTITTTKATGTCPACLGTFRTTASGTMHRHGFNTHNVKHGTSGGWQTGSCQGFGRMPIGTEAGNAYALTIADDHDRVAMVMQQEPAFTTQDAELAAVAEAWGGMARRAAGRREVPSFKTLAEFRALPCFPSYQGWFYPEALNTRAQQMQRARQAEIDGRRTHAMNLRDAVAANPAAAQAA